MNGRVPPKITAVNCKLLSRHDDHCWFADSPVRLYGGQVMDVVSIQTRSVLWILCSLHQQSVLASLLVLPPVSIPPSCEGGSRWFLSLQTGPSSVERTRRCPRPRFGPSPRCHPFILHPTACGGAEDERAREGLSIRLCRGPGTRVGYLQRLAF